MDNLPELPVYAFQPNLGGLLSMILTIVLPLAVAVITTRLTSSRVKTILLLVVVAIKTLVEALISNGADYINFGWVPFLMNLILNLVIAAVMHLGVWKPTGLAAKVQDDVGLKTRGDGWHEAQTR
jgi:hypothetical protein